MKDYLFVLGRDPELSLAELISYFNSRNIQYKLHYKSNKIAIFSIPELDFKKLISCLGGTVKIAEVLSSSHNLDEIEYNLEHGLKYEIKDKLRYSISCYDKALLSFVESYLKNRFKREGIKAVYKKPKRKFTSQVMPSKLISKDIIETGLELILYKDYIGKTIAVFNPKEHIKRDLQRPVQDYTKSISIRLAKILVNLSQAKENEILLDPFCGTGVILQEALLNGINIIGIDIEKSSIDASKNNLEWLKNNYKTNTNYELINADSRELSKFIKEVDAVATEPYLGPLIKQRLTENEANKLKEELESLYFGVLKEIKKVLKKQGRISIVVPVFKTKKGRIFLNIKKIIGKIGFKTAQINNIAIPLSYFSKESKLDKLIYIFEHSNI
ncbi:MAG: DNA methyltransferase [Nanoarchaeota archaeon]